MTMKRSQKRLPESKYVLLVEQEKESVFVKIYMAVGMHAL